MATKPLSIVMTCCAGALALGVGWLAGEDLFFGNDSASVEDTADSVSVLVKTLPSPNRDVKQDKTTAQERVDTGLRGALPYAENPPTNFPGARAEFSPMPPPMRPNEPLKNQKPSRAYLNDAQLVAIKQRLKLTKAQEKYWVPVEAGLRNVMQQIADYQTRLKSSRGAAFDLQSHEIEQLKAAAIPFFAQLRDDQKNQVKMLANMAGLGPVVMPLIEPQVAKNEAKNESKNESKDGKPDSATSIKTDGEN